MQTEHRSVNQLVDHLFRHEAGKMVAVLTRLLGFQNINIAEDLVQDTLLQAMSVWKFKGVPDNPEGWLYTVAKNRAIDYLRSEKRKQVADNKLSVLLKSEWTLVPTVKNYFLKHEIEDSQLRMIFACCHPSIPYESQIALTLKTLCGLSVHEIANGFLTTDKVIAKRVYRAKEKLRENEISMEIPAINLAPRLETVLKTLYLLFNEGYNSSNTSELIREDLCGEAMRLCILLTQNELCNQSSTNALLALMCLQASRFDSRIDKEGEIVLLKDQDRGTWNKKLIKKGIAYLRKTEVSTTRFDYQIEASIAACHALASDFDKTNWSVIYALYSELAIIKPGSVVEMNRAIAKGYSTSPQEGLDFLLSIEGLETNHLYQTALGDFYKELNSNEEAQTAYRKALGLTPSEKHKTLLQRKIEEVI